MQERDANDILKKKGVSSRRISTFELSTQNLEKSGTEDTAKDTFCERCNKQINCHNSAQLAHWMQ